MSETTLHELAEQNSERLAALADALDVDDPTRQTDAKKASFLGFDSPSPSPSTQKSLSDADRTAALIKQNAETLQHILEAVDEDAGRNVGSEKAAFLGME
ncbi:hypothetical protein [Halopelagius fulvigenes]|uniref:Uncharacterized protein n=1 Tax=Halopelagius fulvigenes TaxID=1198324 RepID=A0ABD5TS83_9EURY